jgi:type I restriction enzyme S subunit
VKDGVVNKPNEFVPESIYDSWMTRGIPELGDVFLTTEAPLGEVAQLKIKGRIVVGQRLITLRGKKGILDNTFLNILYKPRKCSHDWKQLLQERQS